MNFSVQVSNDHISWNTLQDIAQAVDKGSWHTLWNYDHLIPPFAELMPHVTDDLDKFEEGDTFEGWSLLAAWAAQTRRVRLGCLVTAIPFRNPALLAKTAVTIDHVSGGRLELGLGAAWHVGETRAYGIPLGGNKEKLDRFAEGLEVIRLLLDPAHPGRRDFQGKYFQLDRAPFAPLPVQKKLPILIGGGGEKRTLRLVAQYADSYNFFANMLVTPEIYAHKNRVLDQHCADIGRDPKEIKRSVALFADIEDNEALARGKREFMGRHLDDAGRDLLLFGTPQRIIDGVERILAGTGPVDEVIFCGLTNKAEQFYRFDEEVLAKLGRVEIRKLFQADS